MVIEATLIWDKKFETVLSITSHFLIINKLGGTDQINQECRESKEERKERRNRRVERRASKKVVDCVVEEDHQDLGNWEHKNYTVGREVKEATELQ